MKVKFELEIEKLSAEHASTAVRAALETLVVINQVFLKENPDTPGLYDLVSSGKVAQRRGQGASEAWSDIPHVLSVGSADAVDLVCWRVAELRAAGYEDVAPYIKTVVDEKTNARIHQVLVRVGDCIEDPSKLVA
jgi:hypothetical protein